VEKTAERNPYVAGKALSGDYGFVGREDVFELVETEMSAPDRNAVVLFGQRRIGKTSMLMQLHRRLPRTSFVPVYFDLMDWENKPLGRLLAGLAAAIASQASLPAPSPEKFDDDGQFFRKEFLPALYQELSNELRPVLLFDEFDVLDANIERELPPTAAGRSFFPYLRRLMEGEPRLGFIFVVGRKAEDLSVDVKATFKAARYRRISVLEDEDARALVRTAEHQGSLAISPAAVQRILQHTSGHPYMTQLLCQLLWDRAHGRNGSGKADAPDVDAVAECAPEVGETTFEWIWEGLPPAERVVCSAVAKATEKGGLINSEELADVLQKHGIRIMTREMELAPDALVKWEMLREQDGRYGFFIELMRRWVAGRKPLARAKDELDRVVPLADTLFQSGDGFYRRGNLDNAQALLEQSLTVNPNHLKSRLLLGQVLIEQGKLEDAIRELEEVYRYDPGSAQHTLVRTWLVRGEELTRAGDEEKALAACDRVLQLSPQDKVALERRQAIWTQRGDRFMKSDLDAAIGAFEQIGAQGKIAKAKALKKHVQISELAMRAWQASRVAQWEKTVGLYTELCTVDADDANWKEKLEWAKAEQRCANVYSQANDALGAQDTKKAQQLLLELLHSRPDYQNAAELLVQVLRTEDDSVLGICKRSIPGLVAKAAFVVIGLMLLKVLPASGGFTFYLLAILKIAVGLAAVELFVQFAYSKEWFGLTKKAEVLMRVTRKPATLVFSSQSAAAAKTTYSVSAVIAAARSELGGGAKNTTT
jgi:tetratricopeptide (TPR) repeat protein